MKNLLKTILFVVICYSVLILVKGCMYSSDNTDKLLYDFDKKLRSIENVDNEVQTTPIVETEQEPKTPKNHNLIKIVGLGDVDYSVLEETSKIIEDFYGYSTSIVGSEQISSDLFINGDTLDAYKCVTSLGKDVKTIYVTNNNLYDNNGTRLRGYTTMYGNTIIVRGVPKFIKETTIHEIGHTLGLDHCSDLTCIMAINNDEQDSGDFCSKCKNIINNN